MRYKEHSIILGIVSILAAGAVYFVFAQDPEEILTQSSDGEIVISGRVRLEQYPRLITIAEHDPFFLGMYRLLPSEVVFEAPLRLSVQNTQAHIFYFNEAMGVWEEVFHQINVSGVYAISTNIFPAVNIPEGGFLNEEEPPEDAVSYYEIYAMYTQGDQGELVRVPGITRAGCAGATQVGDGSVITTRVLPAVDERPLVAVRVWTTRSSGGCAVDEPLRLIK